MGCYEHICCVSLPLFRVYCNTPVLLKRKRQACTCTSCTMQHLPQPKIFLFFSVGTFALDDTRDINSLYISLVIKLDTLNVYEGNSIRRRGAVVWMSVLGPDCGQGCKANCFSSFLVHVSVSHIRFWRKTVTLIYRRG